MDFNIELHRREAAHVPTRPNPNYSHFPILHQTMQRSQYCKCAHLIIFCTVLQTLCPTLVCLVYTHIYTFTFIYFILHRYVRLHQNPPCFHMIRNALNRNCSQQQLCFSYFVFGMFYSALHLEFFTKNNFALVILLI